MTKRRRFRYDDSEPFIELLQPKYHPMLRFGKMGNELKSLLKNGDKVDINTMTYLEFRLTDNPEDDKPCCTHEQIYKWFAKLLLTTRSEGIKYGKAMIFRYITNGHSNLSIDELSLKTAVDKEIRKIQLTNI